MLGHNEIEAKFDAKETPVEVIQEMVDALNNGDSYFGKWRKEYYRHVKGSDTFFKINGKTLRVRNDICLQQNVYEGENPPEQSKVCFTVKERRSQSNLFSRKEVDLFVGNVRFKDVQAFMDILGAQEEFSITKEYHIWVLEHEGIKACLAVYDVSNLDGSNPNRFLEIEIEKDSQCELTEAMGCLRYWVTFLQTNLGMGEPLNTSLYELYSAQ